MPDFSYSAEVCGKGKLDVLNDRSTEGRPTTSVECWRSMKWLFIINELSVRHGAQECRGWCHSIIDGDWALYVTIPSFSSELSNSCLLM